MNRSYDFNLLVYHIKESHGHETNLTVHPFEVGKHPTIPFPPLRYVDSFKFNFSMFFLFTYSFINYLFLFCFAVKMRPVDNLRCSVESSKSVQLTWNLPEMKTTSFTINISALCHWDLHENSLVRSIVVVFYYFVI